MLTKLKVLYGAANIQVLYGAAALTFSLLLVAVVCAACTRRRAPGWNTHGRHTKLPAEEEEQFTESTAPLPVTELTEESATISGHAKPVDHRAVRVVQAPLQMPPPLPLPPLQKASLPPVPPVPPEPVPLPLPAPLPPPLPPPPPPSLEPPLQLPPPQQTPTPEAVPRDTCDDADQVYSL